MISNIYNVSLFSKPLIGAEYHEQKSTGDIKLDSLRAEFCLWFSRDSEETKILDEETKSHVISE